MRYLQPSECTPYPSIRASYAAVKPTWRSRPDEPSCDARFPTPDNERRPVRH